MFKINTMFLLLLVYNSVALEEFSNIDHQNIILYTAPPDILRVKPNRDNHALDSYPNKNEDSARRFLQLHKSLNPAVLLIDSTQRSQEDASNFVKSAYKLNPKSTNINFMLMRFNSTGVTGVLETTQNNKARFLNLLQQRITEGPSSLLGRENANKSAAFFSILNAAHILPPDSAIVVFIKRGVEDETLAQHALLEVTKKRVKVFAIWGGIFKHVNEVTLLKELALRTGGDFIISAPNDLSFEYLTQFLEDPDISTTVSLILSKKNLVGEHNLHFPIDSDVTGIHISVTPSITRGILTTPRGHKIDVLDSENVAQYAAGSFTRQDTNGGIHEIHLNTTSASTQDVGLWSFRVTNAHSEYNVAIFAHSKLTTNAIITFKNATGAQKEAGSRIKVMKLGVSGDITVISNISFVNEDGKPIVDNVKFALGKDWENHLTENIENFDGNQSGIKEFDVDVEDIPVKEPFYAVISGKDSKGKDFTRMSYVRSYSNTDIFQLPPLTIDMGVASQLLIQGNRQSQLYFEVTNNGNTATFTRFYCSDERSILFRMEPQAKWISPQETSTVIVTLTTRPGSYKDLITFTADGTQRVEKRVIVEVGATTDFNNDRTEPELNYHYTSDCSNVVFSECQEGTWTVEINGKDTGSGLLQISSKPKGLHFPNGFIAGTKEQVTGYFSESCCNPDLQLVAVDRVNNRRTVNINAYRSNLGPAAIAAIVLGVLLLILIIVVIILLILRCVGCICPKKESYDLPTYRGPSGRSNRS